MPPLELVTELTPAGDQPEAIAKLIDGELVWQKHAGVREKTNNAPVTPETVFRIASMTKSFTAMAIMKLRDEGKLSLDDPVAKYVPELANLPYPTADSQVLTIRHLLTHSEGFPEDNPWGDRQLAQSDATMRAWLRAGIPFSTSPGTAFEYSNYGFAILGQIVAKASGRPYDVYVRDNILRPAETYAPGIIPSHIDIGDPLKPSREFNRYEYCDARVAVEITRDRETTGEGRP